MLGSESGVLDLDPATVVAKGRLQPGRMFLVDTARGEIRSDDDVKAELAAEHPYGEWLHAGLIQLDDLPDARARRVHATSRSPGASRSSATPRRSCALLHRADGDRRRRAARLDGHRHPARRAVEAAAAAVRLLHRAVRAGHQPAAGRDPRGAGHLAGRRDRPGAEPARARPGVVPADRHAAPGASTTTSWPRSGTSTPTATCPASSAR